MAGRRGCRRPAYVGRSVAMCMGRHVGAQRRGTRAYQQVLKVRVVCARQRTEVLANGTGNNQNRQVVGPGACAGRRVCEGAAM